MRHMLRLPRPHWLVRTAGPNGITSPKASAGPKGSAAPKGSA
jgi:hypothetical protein